MPLMWEPSPGDRIRTVVSKDHTNELVYLNGDHLVECVLSDEFLIFTSEWVPWPHQIIDQLSRQRGLNRRKLLERLIELDRLNSELDFDQLCAKLLHCIESDNKKSIEAGFATKGIGNIGE